jgi:hypothetical protein
MTPRLTNLGQHISIRHVRAGISEQYLTTSGGYSGESETFCTPIWVYLRPNQSGCLGYHHRLTRQSAVDDRVLHSVGRRERQRFANWTADVLWMEDDCPVFLLGMVAALLFVQKRRRSAACALLLGAALLRHTLACFNCGFRRWMSCQDSYDPPNRSACMIVGKEI